MKKIIDDIATTMTSATISPYDKDIFFLLLLFCCLEEYLWLSSLIINGSSAALS